MITDSKANLKLITYHLFIALIRYKIFVETKTLRAKTSANLFVCAHLIYLQFTGTAFARQIVQILTKRRTRKCRTFKIFRTPT